MSRTDGSSDRIVAQPGPIDGDERDCDHCPDGDAAGAVYRAPDPSYGIATVSALCAYHLAVLEREHPDLWQRLRRHEDYGDPEEFAADGGLVEMGDLQEELAHDGGHYQRFGLDERGRGYFVSEADDGSYHFVEVEGGHDVREDTRVPEGGLLELLDHVEGAVGWRGLVSEWVDRAYAEDDGGESA